MVEYHHLHRWDCRESGEILGRLAPADLFSQYLQDYFPVSASRVQFHKDDLLPSSQRQPLTLKRHCKAWTDQRSPNMGMPVSVMPPHFMLIIHFFGSQPFKYDS